MGEEAEAPVLEQAPENPEQGLAFEIKEPVSSEEWAAAFALRQKMLNYSEYGNDAGEEPLDHDSNTSHLIAISDGKVVATGRMYYPGNEENGEGGVAQLSRMAVDPNYQARGIGKALVAEIEARAKNSGAKAVELKTLPAEKYYLALGYKTVKRVKVPLGKVEVEVAQMRKELE